MGDETEEHDAWERRLRHAEQELSNRERQVLARDPSPEELLALAAERDGIARERDDLATSYDAHAVSRDRSGLERDVAGSGRDRRARATEGDRDPAALDRWFAGTDRDFGAGDRGDSYVDRGRSLRARERAADDRDQAAEDRDVAAQKASEQDRHLEGLQAALETRAVIGQAQGICMAKHQMSADTAFSLLVRLSQNKNVKLREVAAQLVAEADRAAG